MKVKSKNGHLKIKTESSKVKIKIENITKVSRKNNIEWHDYEYESRPKYTGRSNIKIEVNFYEEYNLNDIKEKDANTIEEIIIKNLKLKEQK